MIDENKLSKFSEIMIKSYKTQSILNQISRLVEFSKEYSVKEFIQIGHRTRIPKRFFFKNDNFVNDMIASDFARSIVFGEENFILESILKKAEKTQLNLLTASKSSYEELRNFILEQKEFPTDIFIPIKSNYWKELHENSFDKVEYKDNMKLLIDDRKINVHWSTDMRPFKHVFLINKNGLTIVQKKFEDMIEPKWLGNILHKYGQNEPIRIDLADSDNPDEFELYFRSVILIASIDRDSVSVIKIPE